MRILPSTELHACPLTAFGGSIHPWWTYHTPSVGLISTTMDLQSVLTLPFSLHTPSSPQSLQFIPLSSPSYYLHTSSHHLPQHNPSLTQTPLNQTPPTTKLVIAQHKIYFCLLCSCTACYVAYVASQRAPVLHSNL